MGLFIAIALGVGAVFLSSSSSALLIWASVSLIWLILPALLITLIFILILGAILYGVIKLIGALPGLFQKLFNLLDTIQQKVEQGSNTAAKPLITVYGWSAAVKALFGRQP